jgi:hypothetical protein
MGRIRTHLFVSAARFYTNRLSSRQSVFRTCRVLLSVCFKRNADIVVASIF